jgi:pre-rRNA-processing protein TSR4
MWNSSDDEVNEYGQAVQLYVPAKGPARRTNTDALDSHIGGMAHQRESPVCSVCQDSMRLLVQLRLPNTLTSEGSKVDRMLFVFACPRASCFEKVQFVEGFASGVEQSVMSCQTVETPVVVVKAPEVPVAPTKSSWYTDDGDEDDEDDDNDWGGTENLAGLEEAMSAMEQNLKDGALPKHAKKSDTKTPPTQTAQGDESTKNANSFPCFVLSNQMEPPAPNPVMDQDDVGMSASDDKIRNMLARYMATEEDEDILSALKGTAVGGGIGEEDERLTEKERLLLGFQDRLRRVPRQVVRYAKGGAPLWSIPSTKKDEQLWKTPVCTACSTPCCFEMQILPSLLHVLQVDQFSPAGSDAKEGDVGIGDLLSKGMNWGSVAVFACPNSSCSSHEGPLVIQASVDENPEEGSAGRHRDFTPTMAVVEDMDDDADFEPYVNS